MLKIIPTLDKIWMTTWKPQLYTNGSFLKSIFAYDNTQRLQQMNSASKAWSGRFLDNGRHLPPKTSAFSS